MLKLPSKYNKQQKYLSEYRGSICLNCEHPLDISDRFCPQCSQPNTTKKLSTRDFFDEFFSSLVSYDSKLLRTLGALLLKPGSISTHYIAGKRVSYTNPFRFLLSLSIIYFILINFYGDFESLDKFGYDKDGGIEFFNNLSSMSKKIEAEAQDSSFSKVSSYLSTAEKKMLNNTSSYYDSISQSGFIERHSAKQYLFNAILRKDKVENFFDVSERYKIPETRENKISFTASRGILKTSKQPGSFVKNFISKLPFLVFFFLPLFSLFLKLAYIRKKHSYTDHLIFSFHNQSLLFILLIISTLLDHMFNWQTVGFFLLIFGIYLFLSMKRFYKQGFFKTFLKYSALNMVFIFLASMAVSFLILGAAFTY